MSEQKHQYRRWARRQTTVSPEMTDRILAYIRGAIERTKARKAAGDWKDEDEAWDHLHALITGCLTGATCDAHAENQMRLGDDLESRHQASALVRVLAGEVDLVALLAAAPARS